MEKPTIYDPRLNPLQVLLSDRLQMGDVLEALLGHLGPCGLLVATFSTGEEFLRKLIRLRGKGLVTHAALFLDTKAAEKTARTNPMLRAAFDRAAFCQNHAKLMLLCNALRETACVITSQNMTRGNRLESYVVLGDYGTFARLVRQLSSVPCSPAWETLTPDDTWRIPLSPECGS